MTAWIDFLHTQGARHQGGQVSDFGDSAAELAAAKEADVLADLSHFGLLGLSGEDAQTFLHAQITNDLRALTDGKAVFAAHLSAKGRMLANFLVMRRAGELLLLLPESLRENLHKRLAMFILRSRVKLRDAGGEWVRLGINGPHAAALLTQVLGREVPTEGLAMLHTESAFALCLGEGRYDLFVAPDQAPATWTALAARARPVGAPVWDWLLVRAGVPVVLPATQDHFVPQMANMEILGGVSFNKGCYPGQEIVARSQYLGKVKRRLYLAHVEAEARPGDELFAPEPADQAAGLIANAAPAPGGGWDVLAVVLSPSVESGEVRLKSRDGARLEFSPLPYPLA